MGYYYRFSKFDLLFLITVFYVAHSKNYAQILNDRISLLSFMSGITNDPEHALETWINNTSSDDHHDHVCKWSGVACDMNKNRVVELNLSHKSLRGRLSPALFDLSSLEILDLSGNYFEGTIPSQIGSLTQLTELSLSSNLLEGDVPHELGYLKKLVYLNLGGNFLSGEIPVSLLCNGSSLEYFDLSNNSLSGGIPFEDWCEVSELKFLLLWSNRLVGEVPLSLSNSSKLEWIDLESNSLTGELPSRVLKRLPRLKFIYLSYNHFSSHNDNTDLTPFFESLSVSSYLQELDLAGNLLGGELPSIISDLSPSILQINLDSNLISGSIPSKISNLENLTLLNLSNNLLSGSIPSELCKMGKLERLYLSNNSLSGQIPFELGNMSHLGLLDLSRNKLSGQIPDNFSNLQQLRRLLLYENELTGQIPSSLSKCVNLEILDLSKNKISGSIPREVADLSSLKMYLNLSSNKLSGHIPLELSKMDMVLSIDLSSNELSGFLPSQLGNCIALEHLNLSHNKISGEFPASVGGLPYLRELDVSFNEFSGEIPLSLRSSTTLKQMNFSYNDFSGNITGSGAFSSLTVGSLLGNRRLCGSIEGLRSCRGNKKIRTRRFVMAILLSLVITPVFLVVGYPVISRSRLKPQLPAVLISAKKAGSIRRRDEEEGASEEVKYPRISYRQLFEATGGFSEPALIGSGRFGRVYKGVLSDGTRVAVKVLNSSKSDHDRKISASFKRECQVLKRTRHRNLIRIITTCSKPDFKALVLPLMANGSLEAHLYDPTRESKDGQGLDLARLVSICGDVAEGMAYLHHYSPVKVVHCDLKPSNILLDEDMNAVVTDFGIARLVRDDEAFNDELASYDSTDGLLCGSIGYIAPEYGMGKHASTQGDVYSFGVLILEIITGKRPTDLVFAEGSSMHEWVKSHYPEKLEPIIERAMVRSGSTTRDRCGDRELWRSVIVELIELGLICTQVNPCNRPTMQDVAHEVSLLKQHLRTESLSAIVVSP